MQILLRSFLFRQLPATLLVAGQNFVAYLARHQGSLIRDINLPQSTYQAFVSVSYLHLPKMHMYHVCFLVVVALGHAVCGLSLPQALAKRSVAQYHESDKLGATASESSVCSRIGVNLIKDGGNAADALVGTVFCIGVIGMYHSGIGGGGFMLVRGSNGSYTFIDFRETAPAAAFQDMYNNNTALSLFGGLARHVVLFKSLNDKRLIFHSAVSRENFVAWSISTTTLADYLGPT